MIPGPQGEESCEDTVRGRVQQHFCVGWNTWNRRRESRSFGKYIEVSFSSSEAALRSLKKT